MFGEALESFRNELRGLSHKEIRIFLADISWPRTVESLVGSAVSVTAKRSEIFKICDLLCCPFCCKILEDPVTLQCGCTCCTSCRPDKNQLSNNKSCAYCCKPLPNLSRKLEINVTVKNFLTKLFATESEGIELRKGGTEAYKCGEFLKALKIYDKVVKLCPQDHLAWRYRAEILLELGRTDEALENLLESQKINPFWDEVFLLKAKALLKGSRKCDAAVSLLICIMINHHNIDAITLLNEVVLDLLTLHSTTYQHDFNVGDLELQSTRDESVQLKKAEEESQLNTLTNIFQQFRQETDTMNKTLPQLKATLSSEKLKQLELELECNLCSRLIYEPVTTVCGHLFCKDCLRRWLDHDHRCPLCRFSLFEFIGFWDLEITTLVDQLTKELFPEIVKEMADHRSSELRQLASVATDTAESIPIFVCSNSLPTRPIRLQIFEPRYRLMLRQCMESGSKQFGMCAYSSETGFADYGSMVEVKNAYFVPDGRAFLECCGGRRFKVLSREMKDGYNTAKVRWLKDAAVTDNDLEMLSKLNSDVYAEMKTFVLEFLKRQNQSVLASQIQFPALENDKIGSRDGPSWVWWLIDCFIEATEHKIEFISSESLEERLNIIRSQLSMSC